METQGFPNWCRRRPCALRDWHRRIRSNRAWSLWMAAREGLLLAFGNLLGRQIFLVGANCPGRPEWVLQVAVAVAPELVGKRHGDGASRGHGLVERGVGIGHVQME